MKRTTMTVLALIAVTSLPAALVYAQDVIPPVYDATGAMLTAIAPQPTANPRALPWVYDATGAMQASVAPQPAMAGLPPVLPESLTAASLEERMEAQRDAAALAEITRIYGRGDTLESKAIIPPVYDATGALLAALEPGPLEGNMAAVESQTTVADNGLIDPIERAYIERAVSGEPVSAATGALEAGVVQSSEADAQAVVPPTVAATRADPSTYLVIGLGLLAAAALIGAWRLSHRPIHRHGPRHV